MAAGTLVDQFPRLAWNVTSGSLTPNVPSACRGANGPAPHADPLVPETNAPGPFLRRMATAVLAVYWLTLLTATHWPLKVPAERQPMLSSDKFLHFTAYAVLGLLLTVVARIRIPSHRPLPLV